MDRDDSPGNATQAFEHLTEEVSTLHHRLEELVDAIQMKEPPDYAPTLGGIANELADIADRLGAIEGHPALTVAAADYPRALERAGQDLMRAAAERLEESSRAGTRHAQALAAIIGAARSQDRQWKWLVITAAIALILGLTAAPFAARLLPFGLDTRIAAAVMATDRWNAGAALMRAENPTAWHALEQDAQVVDANIGAIAACRAAAAKAKQPQRCTVNVIAP